MTYLAIEGARARTRSTWKWVPLRRVASIRRETNALRREPLLALSVERGIVDRGEDGGRQLATEATESGYWVVHPSDLVFNPMWALEGSVAVSQLRGAVSTAYRVYKLSPQLHPPFLHHYLRSRLALEQYRALVRGVTTFDRSVTREDLDGMPVPVPPVEDQQAIADYLDTETDRIDALITKKRLLAGLLEVRWNSHVRQVALGPGWPLVPLRRLWTVLDCKHRTPTYVETGYPVVSPGDVSPGRLDLRRCHRFVDDADFADLTEGGRRGCRSDIVYSRNASIGIAAYVDSDEPFTMGQDVCLIRSRNQDQLWLTYMLNSIGVDQLEEVKVGSTFDRVNISQLLDLQVPVPPKHDQAEQAQRLDSERQRLDRLRSAIGSHITLLQERRQALITAAVIGDDLFGADTLS